MNKKLSALLAAMIIMVFVGTAHAGWVLERTESDGKRTAGSKILLDKGLLRSDTDAMPVSVVFDWNRDKMYTLFHAKKMYMEQKLSVMSEQLKAQAKMMSQKEGDPKVEVKQTEETQKISGFNCKKNVILENGKPIMEMWVTDELKDTGLMETFNRFFDITGVKSGGGDAILKGMKAGSENGFAMKMVTEARGQMPKITIVYSRIESQKLPVDTFLPPKGYKVFNMQQMMQQMVPNKQPKQLPPMTPPPVKKK